MKRTILFVLLIISSCLISEVTGQSKDAAQDNEELKILYKEDQSDRSASKIDWSIVSKRDQARRTRVNELLKASKVRTAKDYSNAAMIFQHGGDTTSSRMAVKLMKKAVDLDPSLNKWLLAAAIDRYLLGLGQPQIYGTQFEKMGNQPWQLSKIDTTKVTDQERKEYGVGTLAEQREKVKEINKKK
jgi:hypothetical protein